MILLLFLIFVNYKIDGLNHSIDFLVDRVLVGTFLFILDDPLAVSMNLIAVFVEFDLALLFHTLKTLPPFPDFLLQILLEFSIEKGDLFCHKGSSGLLGKTGHQSRTEFAH
jgi:hypothetical protein